jgi:shikimate dehydrogenase
MARDLSAVTTATLRILEFADAEEALDGASLLVNATNAGMQGQPPLSLALDTLPRAAVVCDIVYDPLETPLLQSARSKGHHTIDGLGMLMHQAVPAFAAFFGPTPTVSAALRMELEKALDHGN